MVKTLINKFQYLFKGNGINACFFCEFGAFYYLIHFKTDNDLLITYEVFKQTLIKVMIPINKVNGEPSPRSSHQSK